MTQSITLPHRRHTLAFLAVAATLTLLAGCSGGTSPQANEPSGSTVEADQKIFDMLPKEIQESKTIRIGTEAMYPPYEYIGEDGKSIVGLDPDLVEAIAARIGVDYTLTDTAFDGLLPALDGQRFDMLAAGYTDTKDREAQYDFVNYIRSGQALVVKAGNPGKITSMADICGETVSVLKASVQEEMLVEVNAGECASDKVDIVALPDNQTAFMQIQSGRVVALLVQDPVARYNIAQHGDSDFAVGNPELMEPSIQGFMFTKDSQQLRDTIQAALQSLIDDGTYQDILDSHGLGISAVKEATINGAD